MASQNADGPATGIHKVVQFGVFELDSRSGELRKHGVKLRLQYQSFQVLQALVESPGQVVTREELRRRLWPSDVFLDFDNGLNTAVNRLRTALGDSAENPRYIETLARLGYRFIAPVAVVESTGSRADVRPPAWRRVSLAGFIATIVLVIVTVGTVLAVRRPLPGGFEFRQVTFRRGQIWAHASHRTVGPSSIRRTGTTGRGECS